MSDLMNPYPIRAELEDIVLSGFPNPQSLFERIWLETKKPGQSIIEYLNVHVANTAFSNPALKQALQSADLVYCDGAGIVLGAKILGQHVPVRLTAADWFMDLMAFMSEKNCRVYLLGGEPGVADAALAKIAERVPNHTVVGVHHGYIVNAPEIEQQVFDDINRLQPDLLIVGFGTPIQELWIEKNRHRLNVPAIYALGAILDFVSGQVPRCPAWMGEHGLEWLYRFLNEPSRLMGRYLIGNPWYLGRMATYAMLNRIEAHWKRITLVPRKA